MAVGGVCVWGGITGVAARLRLRGFPAFPPRLAARAATRLRQADRLPSIQHAAARRLSRGCERARARATVCGDVCVCVPSRDRPARDAVAGGEGVARHGGGGWRRTHRCRRRQAEAGSCTSPCRALASSAQARGCTPPVQRRESDTACACRGCDWVPAAGRAFASAPIARLGSETTALAAPRTPAAAALGSPLPQLRRDSASATAALVTAAAPLRCTATRDAPQGCGGLSRHYTRTARVHRTATSGKTRACASARHEPTNQRAADAMQYTAGQRASTRAPAAGGQACAVARS